jgi:hypothetical protein
LQSLAIGPTADEIAKMKNEKGAPSGASPSSPASAPPAAAHSSRKETQ